MLSGLHLLIAQLHRAHMRSISSGVAGGSSLAIALKALTFLDRPDPVAVVEALSSASTRPTIDWFSFALGLFAGVLLFGFVEVVISLRWLLLSLSRTQIAPEEQPRREKPLYRIL